MKILDAGLEFGYVGKRKTTEYIILHHAAGYGTVEYIHASHKALKWSGIGYNFYVRMDGKIYKGRGLEAIGTHTGGTYNWKSVGICAEGNFQDIVMPEVQKKSIIELTAYVWKKYPNAKVIGHRDVDYTLCPGKNFPFKEILIGSQGLIAKHELETPATPRAPASASGSGNCPARIDNCIEPPTLRIGSREPAVITMQELLEKRGHSCGPLSTDGRFGGGTLIGLKNFQDEAGLSIDGICGIYTWRKLLRMEPKS